MADLTKDERKAVSKTVNPALKGDGFDHTYICNGEIFEMLHCFHVHDYATEPCMPEIEAMERCIDRRAVDPDPRVLARKWQVNMRASVFQLFATNKLHGPRRLGRHRGAHNRWHTRWRNQ